MKTIKKRKFDSEVVNDDEEKLSYVKLMRHIASTHPTQENDKTFSVCDSMGELPCLSCCFKRESVKIG